ncbi:hypothetical protein [Aneurinibacillus migulanus]|uniref:Uncharacterized protein n=1 Tax=Aneurinibacillus migulanus TaxID=47500 RepID=A0A0D1VDK7_ANEMI|nr:hypothetical protein [Aneurinibacillus migulanus]KIV57514.1 hypothetical protein TS65_09840 [Aneurinibacillus migulanus]KON94871.1 hypothetical protein AF333_04585 [Aneurinibacillus migulanus]MED0892864.1 hypothetical protein [Aneurinibacillus migulanus]MED1619110.1 hypothetical protein [Aneurinibacillus migulanus]SDI92231.1 hypothetical protein SAMN04487909_109101 [Aneurinibacillus migulanus]
MAKRKTWADAIREQLGEQPEEGKVPTKFMGGYCKCGSGGFTPSLLHGEYIRTCHKCGASYNVDRGIYI